MEQAWKFNKIKRIPTTMDQLVQKMVGKIIADQNAAILGKVKVAAGKEPGTLECEVVLDIPVDYVKIDFKILKSDDK